MKMNIFLKVNAKFAIYSKSLTAKEIKDIYELTCK